MSPRTRQSTLTIGAAVLAAMIATVATRFAYDGLHPCNVGPVGVVAHNASTPNLPHPVLRPGDGSDFEIRTDGPAEEYLAYKGDGTVWVRWPDGNFVEVIPKP